MLRAASLSNSQGFIYKQFSSERWLGLQASVTARVISRQWNDDDEMSVSLVEETGVSRGNERKSNICYFEASDRFLYKSC